ncbi:hypothetical protein V8C86DRAFT_2947564, partial [Haematococcus lacustris]
MAVVVIGWLAVRIPWLKADYCSLVPAYYTVCLRLMATAATGTATMHCWQSPISSTVMVVVRLMCGFRSKLV